MFRACSYLRARILDDVLSGSLTSFESQTRGVAQPAQCTDFIRRRKPSLSYRLRKSFKLDHPKTDNPRRVYAGVILERYPICFQDAAPYKLEHEEWTLAWNSWKYRQVPDEELNADKQNVDETSDEAKFKPEPIITEADKANDIRSLRRKTQGYLYLACKGADDQSWQLPKTEVQDAETLRDAAQRCLNEIVGSSIESFLFGNMPAAHLETENARIFYMLGVVLDGNVELSRSTDVSDYAWLTKPELAESFAKDSHMARLTDTLTVDPKYA